MPSRLRHIRRLPFALALLLAAIPALAADPTGNWVVDREAFAAELRRIMQAGLADLPEAERAQYEALIMGGIEDMVEENLGTVELRTDGEFVAVDGDGESTTGTWTLEGDAITLQAEGDPPLQGTLEDDVMRLRTPPEEGSGETMTIVLRRE